MVEEKKITEIFKEYLEKQEKKETPSSEVTEVTPEKLEKAEEAVETKVTTPQKTPDKEAEKKEEFPQIISAVGGVKYEPPLSAADFINMLKECEKINNAYRQKLGYKILIEKKKGWQ
jgi:hypothetical protein